ncbi:MAG: DNA methyltransferase [Eubacteriales bacterium]|nr:DNA methyltransferase [Eubacteriales bacterium]
MLELNAIYNMDCMEGMKQIPDKYFELAIVDPIYGDVKAGGYMTGRSAGGVGPHPKYNYEIWKQEKTGSDYFQELFRVSKNQIIWGGNYFAAEICRDSPCWIVWDKCNGSTKWADCELAWTSFDRAVRLFRFMWNGMMQGQSITNGQFVQGNKALNEKRIHPTQKPVMLYKWLLQNFATSGDKIIDTHGGSCSSAIACYDMGFDYVVFEKETAYYDAACKRIEQHKAQMRFNLEV